MIFFNTDTGLHQHNHSKKNKNVYVVTSSYKNKRAQSTVDSDEEGSMQEVEMWHTHW